MELIGKLLVAPPAQDDNFWSKSVIFIYEQSNGNTVGLALNKSSDKLVSQLANHHELEFKGKDELYLGGPVNVSSLVMLHTDDWICGNTMHVTGSLRISSDKTMLKRISIGDQPRHWRMFLGMSVWAPGQLEGELSGQHPWSKKLSWLIADADENILFEKVPERMWKRALNSAVQTMTESLFQIN